MSRQRRHDTGIEVGLRKELHRLGLRFRVHKRLLKGLRRETDVVFGPVKVAVFVDGCFWHGCPEHGTYPRNNAEFWREKIDGNRRRDHETDALLTEAGWSVIRVWEHEDPREAALRTAREIQTRRHDRHQPCRLQRLGCSICTESSS